MDAAELDRSGTGSDQGLGGRDPPPMGTGNWGSRTEASARSRDLRQSEATNGTQETTPKSTLGTLPGSGRSAYILRQRGGLRDQRRPPRTEADGPRPCSRCGGTGNEPRRVHFESPELASDESVRHGLRMESDRTLPGNPTDDNLDIRESGDGEDERSMGSGESEGERMDDKRNTEVVARLPPANNRDNRRPTSRLVPRWPRERFSATPDPGQIPSNRGSQGRELAAEQPLDNHHEPSIPRRLMAPTGSRGIGQR